MLQFLKKFKGNEIVGGDFLAPDLYTPAAKAARVDIDLLRFKLKMTDMAKAADASFPGWGNLFGAFWRRLDISHLRLEKPVEAAIVALRNISGYVVHYIFIRDYSTIGDRLASNVYLSSKEGCMKFWEFMLLKANGVPENVIEEWSGIPAGRTQAETFDNGLTAIQDLLEATARREVSKANTALATNGTKKTTTAGTEESGSIFLRTRPEKPSMGQVKPGKDQEELIPKKGWIEVTW